MNHTDACAEPSTGLLSLEAARSALLAGIEPLHSTERIPLKAALGRVLAKNVIAAENIPRQRNSAMDGYAIAGGDIAPSGATTLTVIGTSWAGRPFRGRVERGRCVRIFTGAVLPEGTDTVVMQEQTETSGDQVTIAASVKPGDYVRYPGDDLEAGQAVLNQGRRLTAADIGLLASLGQVSVLVRPKLRVALVSSGDELRPLGSELQPGELYDSNRYSLHAMLQPLPADLIDLGVVGDRLGELEQTLVEAAAVSDALITTGGVSVGDADLVRSALERVGRIDFWKIAMKPGKPFACGTIGSCRFFGLPGNPVSVMVTFLQIVRPALTKMAGSEPGQPLRLRVRCGSPLTKGTGRIEFQRGRLHRDTDGTLVVNSCGAQGSHILNSMSRANCLIILPADCTGVEPNQLVEVEPLDLLL